MKTLPEAVEFLRDHLKGLEVAADCECRIVAAYAPELEQWEARLTGQPVDEDLSRMVRNRLEAQSNMRRFTKQADALRIVLQALPVTSPV